MLVSSWVSSLTLILIPRLKLKKLATRKHQQATGKEEGKKKKPWPKSALLNFPTGVGSEEAK